MVANISIFLVQCRINSGILRVHTFLYILKEQEGHHNYIPWMTKPLMGSFASRYQIKCKIHTFILFVMIEDFFLNHCPKITKLCFSRKYFQPAPFPLVGCFLIQYINPYTAKHLKVYVIHNAEYWKICF